MFILSYFIHIQVEDKRRRERTRRNEWTGREEVKIRSVVEGLFIFVYLFVYLCLCLLFFVILIRIGLG